MKLRFLKTFTLIAALILSFSVNAYAENGSVIANYVNLRANPSTSSEILECLARGTIVDITDKNISGWYAVNYNGISGYMVSDYINILPSNFVIQGGTPFESGSVSPSPAPTSTPDDSTSAAVTPELNSDTKEEPSPSPNPTPTAEPTSSPVPTPTAEPIVSSAQIPTAEPTSSPVPTSTPEPTVAPTIVETEKIDGYINGDYVRFRSGPSLTSSIFLTYNRGKELTILGISDEWTKCLIDGKEGFVFSKYVKERELSTSSSVETATSANSTDKQSSSESIAEGTVLTDGYICGNNVRFRSGPSTSASILGEFFFGNPVSIIENVSDWSKVKSGEKIGYVFSSYIKSGVYSTSSITNSNASGQEIVDFAMKYLGYKYTYGGQLPETGFDCSGFVCFVYNQFGYSLNRVAADQAKNGVSVDSADLSPGDILLFYSNGSIGHSGIYIGDGMFIHAANSNTGVIVTSLEGYYSNRGFIARRITAT